MNVELQPELGRFQNWNRSNTSFTTNELDDLRRDFERFADAIQTREKVLHKKWFKKHVLHIKIDDAAEKNDRTRSFLADMIYEYFAESKTDYLTYNQYMGACELLIKGTIEDKLMWLYSMLTKAERLRASSPVVHPVRIKIPQSPNVRMVDPLMSMRAAMNIKASQEEAQKTEKYVVPRNEKVFSSADSFSPLQVPPRSLTPPLIADSSVHRPRSVRLQNIAAIHDPEMQNTQPKFKLRPLNVSTSDEDELQSIPLDTHKPAEPEKVYLADSSAGYIDVKTFVDMFFGQSNVSVINLGYAGFESLCRRALTWYKRYDTALALFLPNRVADAQSSHAPVGMARFEKSEIEIIKGIFVRYSAYEDVNHDWWLAESGLNDLLREMLNLNSKTLAERIVETFQTDRSKNAAKDGVPVISFDQCVRILSSLMRGTSSEKYGILFQLADVDGDGQVTRRDVQSITSMLMNAIDTSVDTLKFAEQQLVDALFDEYMYDTRTGVVTPRNKNHTQRVANRNQKYTPRNKTGTVEHREYITFREFIDGIHRWELRTRLLAVVYGLLSDISLPDAFSTTIAVDPLIEDKVVEPPSNEYMYIMLLVLVNAACGACFIGGVPGVMGTQLCQSMGIAASQLGLLGSMQSIGLLPGFFTSKWMASRYSLRTGLMINAILQTIGGLMVIVSAMIGQFGIMLMGFLVIGLGDNGFVISLCINRHYQDTLATCFAIYSMFSSLSVVISAATLQVLMGLLGMIGTLWYMFGYIAFSTVCCVVYCVLERRVVVPSSVSNTNISDRFSLNSILQRINYLLPMRHSGTLWRFIKQIRQMPVAVWLIYLHSILTSGGTGALQTFGSSYFQTRYGMSKMLSAFIIPGFYSIIVMILSPLVGTLFDKRGYRLTVLNAAALIIASAFVIIYTIDHPAVPWVVAVMGGTVSAISKGIGNPTMALLVPENLVPEAMLLYGLLLNSGTIVEGNIAGVIMSSMGYNAIWVFCLIISSITCMTALIITVVNRKTSASSLQVPQHRTRMSMVLPKAQAQALTEATFTPRGGIKNWLTKSPYVRMRRGVYGGDPSQVWTPNQLVEMKSNNASK